MDQTRPKHWEYLQQHIDAGNLLLSGRQHPPIGGVYLSGNISREKFESILANDPVTLVGATQYTIIEFNPSFYAQCLQHLRVA